jgi:hypothetical protein
MPRQRKPKIEATQDWKDKIHYVNLSYQQELEIKEWLSQRKGQPIDYLDEIIDDRWAIKFTNRKDGRGITTSVTCNDDDHELAGHTWTMTYGSFKVGILIAYWLVREYLDENAGQAEVTTKNTTVFDDLV